MNLREILCNKTAKVSLFVFLGFLLIFLIIEFTSPGQSFAAYSIQSVNSIIEAYLFRAGNLANHLLSLTGSAASIEFNSIYINGDHSMDFDSGVLLKRWMALLALIILISPVSWKRKFLFIILTGFLHFVIIPVDIAILAHAKIFYEDSGSAIKISRTPGVLVMVTILYTWIRYNKHDIINQINRLSVLKDFIEPRIQTIFLLIYISVFLSNFILGFFEFELWIRLIFNSSRVILTLFGHDAIVQGNLLIGPNGSILMDKNCLAFNTMLLFAAVVYLTGNKGNLRWKYIVFGLVLLNIVNIFRFVFLYMHIQKHGDYKLTMDLHDMYNYIIYSVVFILWVIWFERNSISNRIRNNVPPRI